MKILHTVILLTLFKVGNCQQCSCDKSPELKETISCTAKHFKNRAKLYWQYNCDSSWLVFENRMGKKKAMYSLDAGLIGLTEKLGYSYAAEYKAVFLIQNNVISGCCDPSEFILFDKDNGKKKLNLGRLIFYSENSKYPIVAYFENSNYESFDENNIDCDNITIRNIDNNKIYKIKIPKGRINKTIEITQENFPEHLIDGAQIIDNILVIKYRFKKHEGNDNWSTGTIIIDLVKYSR